MTDSGIVVIGAGRTGRGFIGRLLKENDSTFTFIDKNRELIEELQAAGSYTVNFFGNTRQPLAIDEYQACPADSHEASEVIKAAKLVFIAIGGGNFRDVGLWLSSVLGERLKESAEECSFILCENASKPAEKLRMRVMEFMEEESRDKAERLFGFSESTVFCTTIEDRVNRLNIHSEDYPYLQCDAKPLMENLPVVKALKPVNGFENFLMRKLYTYNSASAIISYLGWWKGYTSYSDAANDQDILKFLRKNYDEVGKALCAAYGYDREDQNEFANLSLKKFRDRTIADTIARNALEPQRKLAPNERIIGPASMIYRLKGDCTALLVTAAAALMYDDPNDNEWTRLKDDLGAAGLIRQVCRLDPDTGMGSRILFYRDKLGNRDIDLLNLLLLRRGQY